MNKVRIAELNLYRYSPNLKDVLNWASEHHKADRMFVTIRTDRVRGRWRPSYPHVEKAVMDLFSPFILRAFLANAWPPCDYIRHPHIVCVMRYSSHIRDIILKKEPHFDGWLNTNGLPEDICLFKSGSRFPAFMSSTHDGQAWLVDPKNIKGDFFDVWEDSPKAIRRRLHINNGYAFCRVWISQRHISVKHMREYF